MIELGKEKTVSIILNPFGKERVTGIHVHFNKPWMTGDSWTSIGTVEFQNTNTKGEQKFSAKGDDAFDQVVLQIREFLNNLE